MTEKRISVQVEVDLGEFTTDELREELNSRKEQAIEKVTNWNCLERLVDEYQGSENSKVSLTQQREIDEAINRIMGW